MSHALLGTPCKRCGGKGWAPAKTSADWPGFCSACEGRGRLTVRTLAKVCQVSRNTIRRWLREGPVRKATKEKIEKGIREYEGEAA